MSLSADNFLFQIITKVCKNDRMGLAALPCLLYTYTLEKVLETSKEKSI